ncbi:MAG: hypothetical protein IJV07_04235 [Alphaproteobacteria bacterium]|nr:hypothetical protein [Alphaproteobacteria bacterium]
MTPEEIKKAKFKRQLFEKIRFEENVFLVFALKLLYRHKQKPLPVQNRIQNLQTEIALACKGRRKRIRGKSIRYGKKLIAATLLKRPDDRYQAEAEHVFPLSGLINQYVRWYAENNYEYTAKRANAAVKNALAIQGQYPTLSVPVNTEAKFADAVQEKSKTTIPTVDKNKDKSFENQSIVSDSLSESDEELQNTTGWERPSEEELAALLKNKCDDNFDSEEDEMTDDRQQNTSAPVVTMIQPDLFDRNITHPLSSKKKNETQKIAHQDINYPSLFDFQNTHQ